MKETGTKYRGLAPHKITPMLGVHDTERRWSPFWQWQSLSPPPAYRYRYRTENVPLASTTNHMLHLDPHSYTLPGRLLLIVSLLIPIAGLAGTLWLISTLERAGRYPLVIILSPFIIVSFVTFVGGSKLLRKFGIRVHKTDNANATKSRNPARQHGPKTEPTAASARTAFCSTCDADVIVDDDDRCVQCRWPV